MDKSLKNLLGFVGCLLGVALVAWVAGLAYYQWLLIGAMNHGG